MRTIQVFISGSKDCLAERDAVRAVITELNQDRALAAHAQVRAVAWDGKIPIPLDAARSPQVSVDNQMTAPEACDIFIGIARCAFGTPITLLDLRKENGAPYLSGTEYEFMRAWHARRRGATLPFILFYRSLEAIQGHCPDDEQAARSRAFFAAPPFATGEGSWGALHSFRDTADFKAQVEYHIRALIDAWLVHAGRALPDWLRQRAARVTAEAGPRYTRDVHVESGAERWFDWLLWRPAAIAALDPLLAKLWDALDGREEFADARAALAGLADTLRACPRAMPDLNELHALVGRIEARARALIATASEEEHGEFGDPLAKLYVLADRAERVAHELSMRGAYARKRVMLLTGPAGQGKTHTLVHELNRVVAGGGIAAGVLCHTLSGGTLVEAILAKLEYRGGWSSFLDELDKAAAQRGERALIVIDALNETSRSQRWHRELSGMLDDIRARPNLAVALSIRQDYLALVLPFAELDDEDAPWEIALHPGFADVEPDALLAYCRHYGVALPVAPPLGELENPLYLRMLVTSLKGKPPSSHSLPSWLEVWTSWMAHLEHDAIGLLDLSPTRRNAVRNTLGRLACRMLDGHRFYIEREHATSEAAYACGKGEAMIEFLISAGALMVRVIDDYREIIEFGFERLNDTFFVDQLLRRLFKGCDDRQMRRDRLAAALAPGGNLADLARESGGEGFLASHRPGMLMALCLAVPVATGVELAELMPAEQADAYGTIRVDTAFRRAVTDSFRWRNKPEQFGLEPAALLEMWHARGVHYSDESGRIDERIKLSLIPGHPLAMDSVMHPSLLAMDGPGARDAAWSIHLVDLWDNKGSNLQIVLRWAREANLDGLAPATALCAGRLLAWSGAVSQRAMRKAAIEGLTRILVAAPACASDLLRDMLTVDDAYVVEGVLVALWGGLKGTAHPALATAAETVYERMFRDGSMPWTHLTIRHYARCIAEFAIAQGWLQVPDPAVLLPPYRSRLPLDQVPDEPALRASDPSTGFAAIVSSACGHDFFWYVLGGTSGPKPFSALPLPCSPEPVRPYPLDPDDHGPVTAQHAFDIPLAARFIAWNCQRLGWTAERFERFDNRARMRAAAGMGDDGRTERIGKKYQWIGWQTMLAFLADNYRMRPSEGPMCCDSPHLIRYIEVMDPTRWLRTTVAPACAASENTFWHMPSLPPWPAPDLDAIRRWVNDTAYELPPADVICTVPELPTAWGDGRWLRIAAESVWKRDFVPGAWADADSYLADVWWQIVPGLVPSAQLPLLLEEVRDEAVLKSIAALGRYNYFRDTGTTLADWPRREFDPAEASVPHAMPRWSVHWTPLAGNSLAPDSQSDEGPLLPLPHLFREWGLELDLRQGTILRGSDMLFGLAEWAHGDSALFANAGPLTALLRERGMTLVWLMAGQRRATLDCDNMGGWERYSSVDMRGVAFLGQDGCVNTACMLRTASDSD